MTDEQIDALWEKADIEWRDQPVVGNRFPHFGRIYARLIERETARRCIDIVREGKETWATENIVSAIEREFGGGQKDDEFWPCGHQKSGDLDQHNCR